MKYYYDNMRHLICVPYSIDNLHKMAQSLNIKRCWFHNAKYPHYDIPKKMMGKMPSSCELIPAKQLLLFIKGSGYGH